MLTTVRLVDGPREMLIRPRDGVGTVDLDWGFPEIRAVVENRTDGDGTVDNTDLFGASAVSMTLKLYRHGTTRALIDELRTFCHPGLRPYLYVADDEWSTERRIRLRAEQQTAPIPAKRGHLREVQVGWKAPDGVWEAAALSSPTVNADLPASVGISFPITFPLAFAATTAVGGSQISNFGGVPSHFVARLYGPCTAPRLINETTGERISFTAGLVLGAGEYVEIDTRDRTANLLSMSSQSRLGLIDFETTSWWQIASGDQTVRYAPLSASAGAVAVIDYRPSWL